MRPTLLPLLLLLACTGDPDETPGPTPDPPQPGPLQVGVARVRMPVPVGIGTAGFGGFGIQAEPSPFAEIYPATTKVHQHPDFRAMVISRGDGFEAVFLRIDTVGIFQQLRRAVVLELKERLGKDLDDALIIGATHTHSGPGRVIDAGGPFELIADKFHPEVYERLVHAMADAVELAYADLAPGRVGFATTWTTEGIQDRRCEDGQLYENGTLPLVAVEREGELTGLLLAYPIHGTVIGIGDLTLGQDVSGGIEQAVEDRLGQPAVVMMMNSWGADMSPRWPELPLQEGADLPRGYEQIAAVGQVVADAVEIAVTELAWTDEPEVVFETHRTRIDREVIGYDDDTFTYPYGAVYCGSGLAADCDPETHFNPSFDDVCVPFNETWPAPDQTEITVGKLGPFGVVTFPGEPGTLLAEQILDDLAEYGAEDVLFVGYGQDYLGYSLLEEDWWQGGYEASGALWGPRQGAYLAAEVVEAWAETFAGQARDDSPDPVPPFGQGGFEPYVPTPASEPGEVVLPVEGVYGRTDVIAFAVSGGDPWLGTPWATLEHASGEPVLRASGRPLDSDGLPFWVELTVDPPYSEALSPLERAFHWTFRFPAAHRVPGVQPELEGTYRLRVRLPQADGSVLDVVSDDFVIE